MPCDSRVQTKMDNVENIKSALEELGFVVSVESNGAIVGNHKTSGWHVNYRKEYDGTYSQQSFGVNRTVIASIARKYAEVGVMQWASRRGFMVSDNDGVQITLVNRRG